MSDSMLGILVTGLGVLGLLVLFAANLLFNSGCLWFVVNHLIVSETKESYRRCVVCTLFLMLVLLVAILCAFIPIPIVNILLAFFVMFKGSAITIEAVFDRQKGGCMIFFLFTVGTVAITKVIQALFGI